MENEFYDIDDIFLRVEIQLYLFEFLVRVEFMENLEENSEISIFDDDDES